MISIGNEKKMRKFIYFKFWFFIISIDWDNIDYEGINYFQNQLEIKRKQYIINLLIEYIKIVLFLYNFYIDSEKS